MYSLQWDDENSSDTYKPHQWGAGYFGVDNEGNVIIDPQGNHGKLDRVSLVEAVDHLEAQGGCLPAIFRFPEIVEHRTTLIKNAFREAIDACDYRNHQTTCYPIKANHRRAVLKQLRKCRVGLEVGTKAELLVAVEEIIHNKDLPLLCNGYKDASCIEFVTRLSMSGIDMTLILEQPSEVLHLIACAKKLNYCPKIGMRLRLSVSARTTWAGTSGEDGMFGFPTQRLITAIDLLRKEGLSDQIKMLHYHLGSQICDLECVKTGVTEATKIYCEIKKEGIPLTTLDVGGGLAVEYDNSKPDSFSTKDYSIQNYARAIVENVKNECDFQRVNHPVIYSESGRAVAAHHSVFVFEVFGDSEPSTANILPKKEYSDDLELLYAAATAKSIDLQRVKSLYEGIEVKYRTALAGIREKAEADRLLHEALAKVGPKAVLNYYGNLSIFQSLPDVWGIKQVFPVMPIHRLLEVPDVNAKIFDITCDSDGKFESFQTGGGDTIPLHKLNDNERYMLGVFNVGAYQETIGAVHNLLALTSAMSITFSDGNIPKFDLEYAGDDIGQVIEPFGFCEGEVLDDLVAHFVEAAANNLISPEFAKECGDQAKKLMESSTYMELQQDKRRKPP